MKVGTWTNKGRVSFIDKISETVTDPLCKVGTDFFRFSELVIEPEPEKEIIKKMTMKSLHKRKSELLKELIIIQNEIELLKK